MSAHTPGPWIVDCEYTNRGSRATVIRNSAYQYVVDEHGISDSDCDLIATAPELLAELSAGVELIAGDLTGAEWKQACNNWLKSARAAIAKATGEQP